MKILALGGSAHSYSACVMKDGRIVSAVEEERLNGRRHSYFPDGGMELARCRAAAYCLKEAGLTASDVDRIVTDDLNNPLYYAKYVSSIRYTTHHFAHACSAFYTSPFEEAAVLVADGIGSADEATGEYETITSFRADSNGLEALDGIRGSFIDPATGVKHELSDPLALYNSLGGMYKWVTLSLGFAFLEDGKTEALSACGTGRWVEPFESFYRLDGEGRFSQSKVEIAAMRAFIADKLREEGDAFQAKADIARAAQEHLQRITAAICLRLHRRTGSRRLCLAGGTAFNRRLVAFLEANTPFRDIYVFPAAGDTGNAVGSALAEYLHPAGTGGPPDRRRHAPLRIKKGSAESIPFDPCLGRLYSRADIDEAAAKLDGGRLEPVPAADHERTVADLLAAGCLIGRFQGRSPLGPGPNGSRCILADPRCRDVRTRLDASKRRPAFLPYGAAVQGDKLGRYARKGGPAPYMEKVHILTERAAEALPAVAHADGSCALLTVERCLQPGLYRLLGEFEHTAGTGALLLTSLNVHGRPMAETPLEAFRAALELRLDYLSIEGRLYKIGAG
ncbi:carbamoyltransferase C-terminal domain-containing protein [Paenibacillus chitinolyticus]